MRAPRLALLVTVAALAGGCQDEGAPALSPGCTDEPSTVVRALSAAPGAVTLADGTPLSRCLRDADGDADLQNVGATFSRAAEDLELVAMRGDERAALQLGYLVGAARKGAATASGIADELVRRLERSAAAVDGGTAPRAADAVQRGLAAGEARG
jgi:hypothetical protein